MYRWGYQKKRFNLIRSLGYGIFSGKCLHKTEILIHGRGQCSYIAACFAIYQALEQLEIIDNNKILILTDCQSFLTKLKKWDSWEWDIERKISDALTKYGNTKKIILQYVKAYNEVGYNCFIDELINARWNHKRLAVSKLKITDAPKTQDKVMNLIKKNWHKTRRQREDP